MALGRTDVQMRLAGQFAAVWLAGLMLSARYGIQAVAASYSICTVLFSLWSLRVCLPFVACPITAYARALLWPMTLTASAVLLYLILSSTNPDHDVIDVCLAATLASIAIAISLIAQRRDLLAALSLPPGRQPGLFPESHIADSVEPGHAAVCCAGGCQPEAPSRV